VPDEVHAIFIEHELAPEAIVHEFGVIVPEAVPHAFATVLLTEAVGAEDPPVLYASTL
jgi:hypothetical protein